MAIQNDRSSPTKRLHNNLNLSNLTLTNMEFGLSETEEMVRASALEFLEREAGPDTVRVSVGSEFWAKVSEMGWPGLAIAEANGGAGMGITALGVLLEQWGAHLAPGPLFESAALVAPLLEESADERVRREVLPQLADGSVTAAIAVLEQGALWRPEDIRAVAVRTSPSAVRASQGWAITGAKHFVSYGDEASKLIVVARTGDGARDISIFLIDRDAEGIASEPLGHASGTPTSVLTFNETFVEAARLIGQENGGWPLIETMMLRGAAFRTVQMAGLGRKVLDTTVAYVKERNQFGVPVGSFQAIQHHLADMAVSVRRVEHLARQAVWSIAEDSPDRARQVSRAKSVASELIPEVCWTAHQCHGAIGFTWEHDLHLYTRRALSWAAEFGDATWHADRLADVLEL